MSVFEQIRPFVNLCQACGMIPYAIENNSMTNTFSRFTFSFKHRVARWFLFILALQIAIVCFARYFSVSKQDDISTDQSLPITIKILSAVDSISSLVQLLFSRWIVLRYRRLQRAIEAVQEVERLFGEEFIAQHKSSLKTRIIIGFILILVTIVSGVLAVMPLVPSWVLENPTAFIGTAAILLILMMTATIFECIFLFIHICNYIISHFMQMVLLDSEADHNHEHLNWTENLKILRHNAKIFHCLCRASSELNHIFSFPVLILLTTKFVSVINAAFIFVYYFVHGNNVLQNYSLVFPFHFFTEWIRILVLLFAADMPVTQVHLVRERLIRMSISRFARTSAEKIAVMSILMQIDKGRVRLSAAGLFNVGVHLIPALTGSVVTYMVILLQN